MAGERLVCPQCGSDQALFSCEQAEIMFPVVLTRRGDLVDVDYDTPRDRIVLDESTTYTKDLYCRNCSRELTESQLVTLAEAAHLLDPAIIQVEEDSDRGVGTRFQAVCYAVLDGGDYQCGWCSPWYRADQFRLSALYKNLALEGLVDPARLAYEAAEYDGRTHLAQYIDDTDPVADASTEGSDDGAQADAEAARAAAGGTPSGA